MNTGIDSPSWTCDLCCSSAEVALTTSKVAQQHACCAYSTDLGLNGNPLAVYNFRPHGLAGSLHGPCDGSPAP